MAIKNYSTSVSEEKTVGEIMGLLAAKGARHIQISYDGQGRPEGVRFVILIKPASGDEFGVPVPFQLPCSFDGVFRALRNQYKDRHAQQRFERNPESKVQARRVAWRIIKDWVEAQIALIEADQASLAQVFLPYAVAKDGATTVTAWDQFVQQIMNQKALPPAEVANG